MEDSPHPEIPIGLYCYDERGKCPYHEIRADKPPMRNGYCKLLAYGDWQIQKPEDASENFPDSAASLLWDEVKECGINKGDEI